MQFYDSVTISVKSGKGGNGSTAWRREKYIAYGGPSGGDGGDGGSIWIQASHNEYTLMPYRVNATYKAGNGEHGKGKDLYGQGWDDKVLIVPVGTHVIDTETGEVVGILDQHDQRIQVIKGWKGGLGNKHFVNAQKQRSTIALLGEPARLTGLTLELQLLADVGLVWAPSVGKSSFINAVSNVKAKVAEYHFTTLVPNLGVISHRQQSFTMIDIPGLIEGAGEGKGLWNDFLRHVQKSSLLALTLDMNRYDSGIHEAMQLLIERQKYLDMHYWAWEHSRSFVWDELISRYESPTEDIISKKRCITCSKSDLMQDLSIREEYLSEVLRQLTETIGTKLTKKQFETITFVVSSATHEWVEAMLDYALYHLNPVVTKEADEELTDEVEEIETYCIPMWAQSKEYLLEEEYLTPEEINTKKVQIRKVKHPDVTFLTYVLPRGNDEAEIRYRQRLEELRTLPRMRKQWLKKWDIFLVESPYTGYDERWVRWE